jgi:hypothetical protein
MKRSKFFNGIPNGRYNSVNELYQPMPSLLLKYVKGNRFEIVQVYDTPIACLLTLNVIRATSDRPNDYSIHTNIQIQ